MKTKLQFSLVLVLLFTLVVARVDKAQAQAAITIGPETLPSAAFQTEYSQQLTANGGTDPYTFSLVDDTLPDGITLSAGGLLSGYPDGLFGSMSIGTYPISIQVEDATGATAVQSFDFVLGKGTPTVTVYATSPIGWNVPITVAAEVKKETPFGYHYVADGTVAFFIDGNPVQGCQVANSLSNYLCENISMNLAVGVHTITAVYTPLSWNEPYYSSSSGSTEFTVQPRNMAIQGMVFGITIRMEIMIRTNPDSWQMVGRSISTKTATMMSITRPRLAGAVSNSTIFLLAANATASP